jgi:Tfp pilus assembly protein PilN
VLDQTTKALPPYTWITRVGSIGAVIQPGTGQAGGPSPTVADDSSGVPMLRVQIDGRTVDIQAYTTFLRQLAASPWFTDVTPASSQTVIEADRPVTAFQVTFRYRVADSVYIRTVPFVQSMR